MTDLSDQLPGHDCTASYSDPRGPECLECGRRANPDGRHELEPNGCADCHPRPYLCDYCPELDGRHLPNCTEALELAAELEAEYRAALEARRLASSTARAGGNLYRILETAPRRELPVPWRDRRPTDAMLAHLAERIARGQLHIIHDGWTYDLVPVMNPWPAEA